MLSLIFRRRLLLSCPQAAAFTPCCRLSSSHQRRAYDANIAHHKNTRLYGKAAQNPSGEATQGRPGHDFSPKSESLGQKVVLDSCDGVVLKDVGGKEFLDAVTGSPLAQPEITREDLARVSLQQMLKLGVFPDQRNIMNSSASKLCNRLSEIAAQVFPDKMAESRVFLTTGQDASIEAAYYLALRFWNRPGVFGTKFLGGYNKQKIITFRNSYRGSTFIPASMSSESPEYGWARWKDGLDRDVSESKPYPMFTSIDPHELFLNEPKIRPVENTGQAASRQLEERILAEGAKNIAAFVFEPVQALGGAVDMHRDFFPLAEEICKTHSILMISDESTSFVKTGHWFGMEMYGVSPDIVVVGDSLTCGYVPAGAIIARKDICQTAFRGLDTKHTLSDSWHHSFTGSSHPICPTPALRTLDIIDNENLMDLCASRGKEFLAILKSELEGLSVVEHIRGTGLIIGVDLTSQIALEIEEQLLLEYEIFLGRSINKHCLLLMLLCAMPKEQFQKIAKTLRKVLSSFNTIVESALRRKRNL